MTVSIAIVDAQTPGNIGTIARAMKNFGFENLLLINPPHLEEGDEAYGYAGHAREDILPNATELSFDELVTTFHTVGFTAHVNETTAKHVRYPFTTPADLVEELETIDADTALVFGREDKGLSNAEIQQLDQVASIPATASYPVLNLGQAVTITLYELRSLSRKESHLPEVTDRAEEQLIEGFYTDFDNLLTELEYKSEKRDKTMRLIRRLIGRAHPTGREITTLRGVLREAADQTSACDSNEVQ